MFQTTNQSYNQNRPEIRSPSFPPPATAGSSATASLAAPRLAPPAAQPPQALRSRRARERPDTWAGKIGQFPRKNGDLPREHGDVVWFPEENGDLTMTMEDGYVTTRHGIFLAVDMVISRATTCDSTSKHGDFAENQWDLKSWSSIKLWFIEI